MKKINVDTTRYTKTNRTSIVEYENFDEGVSEAFCGVPRPLDGYGIRFEGG